MLLATALALLITGCAQQTFTVQNKPAAVAPKETITHHFFVSGIGQRKTVDTSQRFVAARRNVIKQSQQTFGNGLLGFITLGIYILRWKRIVCSGVHELPNTIWATLSALLINILLGSFQLFCIVIQPLSGVK